LNSKYQNEAASMSEIKIRIKDLSGELYMLIKVKREKNMRIADT